jgi:outer membrane protein assembly factor BamE (lipoprotein component of BamABCDE complex)
MSESPTHSSEQHWSRFGLGFLFVVVAVAAIALFCLRMFLTPRIDYARLTWLANSTNVGMTKPQVTAAIGEPKSSGLLYETFGARKDELERNLKSYETWNYEVPGLGQFQVMFDANGAVEKTQMRLK